MIELHAVGRSDDGNKLLLAAHPEAETAGYAVEVNPELLTILDIAKPADKPAGAAAADESEPEPEPPEDPFAKLPEGPLEVASPDEALETAHGLWLVKGDEVSEEPLHDAVIANLNKWNVRISQEILDEGWWVTKLGDRAWQISFRYLSRGRIREAEWVLDTETARLQPENELAETVGFWKKRPSRNRNRRRRGGRGRGRSRGGNQKQG